MPTRPFGVRMSDFAPSLRWLAWSCLRGESRSSATSACTLALCWAARGGGPSSRRCVRTRRGSRAARLRRWPPTCRCSCCAMLGWRCRPFGRSRCTPCLPCTQAAERRRSSSAVGPRSSGTSRRSSAPSPLWQAGAGASSTPVGCTARCRQCPFPPSPHSELASTCRTIGCRPWPFTTGPTWPCPHSCPAPRSTPLPPAPMRAAAGGQAQEATLRTPGRKIFPNVLSTRSPTGTTWWAECTGGS
mmetsp:Transcript_111767/g.301488  ORF Transcript_111767/g.301488 Transcript_111767/m.301488 type:complete len:244 (+) Transcript_111767:333-1064(+)